MYMQSRKLSVDQLSKHACSIFPFSCFDDSSAYGMLDYHDKALEERSRSIEELQCTEMAPKRRKLNDGSYIIEAPRKINK